MRKLFINLFTTLNIIAAISLIAAYLSPFINPNHINIFAFFGIGFPIFLYANIFFIIFWFFIKRKFVWMSLLLLLLGYPMIKRHLQLFPERIAQNPQGIKVMTYNVRNFKQLGSKNIKSTIKSIEDLVTKQNPDIVCFQEFSKSKSIINLLNLGFPAYGQGANIIYTKLKVVGQGIIISEKNNKFGIYADVIINMDTVRVINIQLLSYSVSSELEEYDKTEKVNRKRFFFSVASKLNNGFTKRVEQTETLVKAIIKSPYPLIVCGDFNDPPASFTYQKIISSGLQDAYVKSGTGYGNTYIWSFPKVRIDYILTSSDFELYNYKVLHTNLSDHQPAEAFLVYSK